MVRGLARFSPLGELEGCEQGGGGNNNINPISMPINDKVSLFYYAKPHIFEKAKTLRRNMTPAERLLWNELKNNKILGLHFRRQHPIDIFIADFYCHKIKLVIEIDGGIHNKPERKEYDSNRTSEMERLGIKVIRFKNEDILVSLSEVIETITKVCNEIIG